MIRAIIIDDEQESRNLINNILNGYCKNVEIVAQAQNVKEGIAAISKHKPDAVFLDVEMPDGTGFDLLNAIDDISFQVIFVTAYNRYAIKAIKFSALDYILKPIEPQQLIDAANKLKEPEKTLELTTKKVSTLLRNKNGFERIALPTFEGFKFINVKDIIRCEASSNYTHFYLNNDENILVTKTLKEYDEILSNMDFVRIHQSHLININFVDRYIKGDGGTVVMVDGSQVEVSRRRKEAFLERMIR